MPRTYCPVEAARKTGALPCQSTPSNRPNAAQASPTANSTDLLKRYPKAVIRNFDGKAGAPTEMDALVAYLQMLGTLVDFKLYNEKANLR